MDLDALVAPLRADVVSGAAVVARTAADVVVRALERLEAEERPHELRERTARLIVAILDAQPAMAPLVHLGSRVLTETGRGGPQAGIDEARAFQERLERNGREAARRAAEVLPREGRIVTLSHSSTVRRALGATGPEGIEVVCLESRPAREGRRLARELAREGFDVVFGVDAAAWRLVRGAEAALVGADSIGDRGAVNKIGTRALVEAAREEKVPAYVVVDGAKLLPPGFPQETEDPRPKEEVWSPPPGVRVWNHYFEAVPLARFRGVLTEAGLRAPEEAENERRKLVVPDELRRWAEGRGKGDIGGR